MFYSVIFPPRMSVMKETLYYTLCSHTLMYGNECKMLNSCRGEWMTTNRSEKIYRPKKINICYWPVY